VKPAVLVGVGVVRAVVVVVVVVEVLGVVGDPLAATKWSEKFYRAQIVRSLLADPTQAL